MSALVFYMAQPFCNPWPMMWILFISMLNPALPEVIHRVDPLALLAATLRTYQRAGCDSEQLSLSCPHGTSISIELAQYGRAGDLTDHSLCPPVVQRHANNTEIARAIEVTQNGTQHENNLAKSCIVSGLQYTLLQTVVDSCQKKRHCKFAVNVETLVRADPCAGIRKFVEIAYKCRPYEFRSKVACNNDTLLLVCNPYSRIAIYSASFGYIQHESVQCPHNNTLTTTVDTIKAQRCLVFYATETVMQICHGRRRCSVAADVGIFGKPCNLDVPMSLKIVYTCIPRKVLKERYEALPEPDEQQQNILDWDHDDHYDEDQFQREGDIVPLAPKLQSAIPNAAQPLDLVNMRPKDITTTLMPSIFSETEISLEEHQQLFFLYVIICITAGMLIFTGLIIARFAVQRKSTARKNSSFSVASKNENTFRNKKYEEDELGDKSQEEELTQGVALNNAVDVNNSNVNADIDLINTSNAPYMTCTSTPVCSYVSCATYGAATNVLMPATSQYNVTTKRLYSTPITDTVTIGPQLLTPTGLGSAVPSYFSGTMIAPLHRKTLQRNLPSGILGIMNIPPPECNGENVAYNSNRLGVPTSSNVYYDSTLPKQLFRSTAGDNTPHFYG